MKFLDNFFGKKKDIELSVDDNIYLNAEPISKKRMELLWLDPPALSKLEKPINEHKVITVTLGSTQSNLRDHEITLDDFIWAKQIEKIVDKAYEYGQQGRYKDSLTFYKEALSLAPCCDLFLMSIGVCFAKLGQKGKAILYLEKALQISPENNRIRENLNNIK